MLAPYSLWTNDDPRLHMAAWDLDGPPLLLVHGMGAHTGWYETLAPRLDGAARPVALDLSGHGDSGWREPGAYSSQAWVSDIEDARHALGWDTFALCGHSLGARVALDYAATHPGRLTKLIVVDFLPEFENGGRYSRPRTVPQPLYDSEADVVSRFRLQPDGTLLDAEALSRLARASVKKTREGWTWKFDWSSFRYVYSPLWDTLPKVTAPTLVVRGGQSRLMPQPVLDRVVSGLRQGRAATVDEAHHHVPLDCPEELAAVMREFLGA